jgi:hypothetical protein
VAHACNLESWFEATRTYLEKSHHRKGLVEWLKVYTLSSNPSTGKKKCLWRKLRCSLLAKTLLLLVSYRLLRVGSTWTFPSLISFLAVVAYLDCVWVWDQPWALLQFWPKRVLLNTEVDWFRNKSKVTAPLQAFLVNFWGTSTSKPPPNFLPFLEVYSGLVVAGWSQDPTILCTFWFCSDEYAGGNWPDIGMYTGTVRYKRWNLLEIQWI